MDAVSDKIVRCASPSYDPRFRPRPRPRPSPDKQSIPFPIIKPNPQKLSTSPTRPAPPHSNLFSFDTLKWVSEKLKQGEKAMEESKKFEKCNVVELRRKTASVPVVKGFVTCKEIGDFTIIYKNQMEVVRYSDIETVSPIYMEEAYDIWVKLNSVYYDLEYPILHPRKKFLHCVLVIWYKRDMIQIIRNHQLITAGPDAGREPATDVEATVTVSATVVKKKVRTSTKSSSSRVPVSHKASKGGHGSKAIVKKKLPTSSSNRARGRPRRSSV